MAIEKNPMQPSTPVEGTIEQGAEEITVAIENPDSVAIETDDGGMIIDFDPDSSPMGMEDFNSNLAEFMSDTDLNEMGADLVSQFEADKDSRSEWEESYVKGLDQLG